MGFAHSVRAALPERVRIGIVSIAAASSVFAGAAVATPTPATAATVSDASRVIAIAETHLGAPWVYGATGPYAFDCSGLVYSVFRQAGLLSVIGNARTATQMWNVFAARGQASPTNGQPGDLVIFGYGRHVGIYMGNGRVISTLVTGVGFSTIWNTYPRFTTFLHTHLSGVTTWSAYHYTTTYVHFRAGPATWYYIRATLAPETRVTIIGRAYDGYGRLWDEVRLANGAVGWVASWLLT